MTTIRRRDWMKGALLSAGAVQAQPAPTVFQMACMTLPYSPFPFARALSGIRGAGYRHVALGTTHPDAATGKPKPVLDWREPAARAAEVARQWATSPAAGH